MFSLALEPSDNLNLTNRAEIFSLYSSVSGSTPGIATAEGFQKFRLRGPEVPASFFREINGSEGLSVGSVSLGTRMGGLNSQTDLEQFNAIIDCVISGSVNLLDTAINFRHQKSERNIARALRYLSEQRRITRDQLFIATKGGVVHDDGDSGETFEASRSGLEKKGLLAPNDEFNRSVIAPKFIELQLEQSLRNLHLESVDLYSIMLPEIQLARLPREELESRLIDVLQMLETKAKEGKIQFSGISTWKSFRVQKENKFFLSLEKLVEKVTAALGPSNRFKFIHAPLNLAMPETFMETYQTLSEKECSFLYAASELKMNVLATSPFMAGNLIEIPMSSVLFKANYQGPKALNFLRSLPYESLKSVIMGAKQNRHVKTNLNVSFAEPLTREEFTEIFASGERRTHVIEESLPEYARARE